VFRLTAIPLALHSGRRVWPSTLFQLFLSRRFRRFFLLGLLGRFVDSGRLRGHDKSLLAALFAAFGVPFGRCLRAFGSPVRKRADLPERRTQTGQGSP